MCGAVPDAGLETSNEERADQLRQAIACHYALLFRHIGTLVYRLCGRLRREEAEERTTEIFNEAVKRALQVADRFDPQRSAVAWLIGFALNIVKERRRGRTRRPVAQSDLGDEAWRQALEGLCVLDADTTIRLDIRQALARLTDAQRDIIELRFFAGLDGEAFAQSAGAPSLGAARIRLARALQALRAQFRLAKGEVTP